MLEREAVTGAVGDLLRSARSGHGGAVFVLGEAGLGKSALVAVTRQLAAPDMQVGVAHGEAMEAGLPFALVLQLVESVSGTGGPEPSGGYTSADDARASFYYRVLRWLQGEAAAGALALVVDDLHWSDEDSLGLLSYLCRRLESLPVAVVATLRPWPPAAADACMGLVAAGHAHVERLLPLSGAAARVMFVESVGRPVADDVVERASAAGAGNPFLLGLLAAAAAGNQTDQPLHAPLLHRFGPLSPAELALARAASVLGARFPTGLALTLAGLEDAEAPPALTALTRSGLVRDAGDGGAEFTHPLFQQALYEEQPAIVRQELHARAFRLLLGRGAEAEAAEHAVLGDLAGDADAVAVLSRAGRSALQAGGLRSAVRRLQAAVRLAGDRATPELTLLLAEAVLAGGAPAEAAALYRALLEGPPLGPTERAGALRMFGRSLFLDGDVEEGGRRFDQAASAAGPGQPALAVQAVLDHSRAAWLTGGPAAALAAVERARGMASEVDDALRAEIDAAWGFVAFAAGDPEGLEVAMAAGRRSTSEVMAARDLWWNWGTRRNSGRAAKYAERFDEAERVFALMFAQAEATNSPHAIVSLAAHQADTLARRGQLDEALAFAARASAMAELAPLADAFAYAVEALVLWHLGRHEESEARRRAAEEAAAARGQWLPLLRALHLRAVASTHRGDVEQASALYARLEDESVRLGIGEPCLVPWAGHAAIAHVAAGRVDAAERAVAWVDGWAGRLPCRWPRIATAAGRAALAEARGDDAGAHAEHRAALALHADVDLPIERVETLSALGGFLRRTGRLSESREVLREALAAAEDLGARTLAESAQAELAVAGGRRRRRDATPGALTAQERRVARLAGAGHSASEIAHQLSLSVRTIETHLGRIYAKLGVHSQRELMARRSELS